MMTVFTRIVGFASFLLVITSIGLVVHADLECYVCEDCTNIDQTETLLQTCSAEPDAECDDVEKESEYTVVEGVPEWDTADDINHGSDDADYQGEVFDADAFLEELERESESSSEKPVTEEEMSESNIDSNTEEPELNGGNRTRRRRSFDMYGKCYKMFKISDGETVVSRGCYTRVIQNECNIPNKSKKDYTDCFICEEDECNGGGPVKPSNILFVLLSMVTAWFTC